MSVNKQQFNILFINSIDLFGGGEVWMITAMEELMRRGHKITLICRPKAEILHHAESKGIDVFPLKIRGDFDPVTIYKVIRFLIRNKIDVILTNTDKELRFGGIAARIAGVKAVICRKGIDYPLKNNLRYRLTYNCLASVIVANSLATKFTLLQNAPWLDSERIKVIYNGINPEIFSLANTKDLREELEIPDSVPLLGFVGRLNEQKGITYLLQAFEKVQKKFTDVKILIVGEGNLKEEIESFALQNNLQKNIHLPGFRNDIANIMQTIDILVLPSLWEGFGIVLTEAMAAGKPCITTKISSMPEIVVDGETGFIVPPKDVDALAEAMITCISDKKLAANLGANGKEVVLNKFTLKHMIDQYEEIFYAQSSAKK